MKKLLSVAIVALSLLNLKRSSDLIDQHLEKEKELLKKFN